MERSTVPAGEVTHLGVLREDVVNQPFVPGAEGTTAAAHTWNGKGETREHSLQVRPRGPGNQARCPVRNQSQAGNRKVPPPECRTSPFPGLASPTASETVTFLASVFCLGSGTVPYARAMPVDEHLFTVPGRGGAFRGVRLWAGAYT